MLRWVLPFVTQIKTVLLGINSIIVLGQLDVSINYASVKRAFENPHSEDGEDNNDYL